MTDTPAKPVLLTGASGALGRVLTKSLSAAGWTLRLTDIAAVPRCGSGGRVVHPRRPERRRDDAAAGRGMRRDRASRRRVGGAAVRGSAGPEYPRPVSHLRSGAARAGAGGVRVVEPLDRLPRAQRVARRRHAVPARRVLRIVEGVWRADGPAVLAQAWRGERVRPHRLGVSRNRWTRGCWRPGCRMPTCRGWWCAAC